VGGIGLEPVYFRVSAVSIYNRLPNEFLKAHPVVVLIELAAENRYWIEKNVVYEIIGT
jgi:hypothetical protein